MEFTGRPLYLQIADDLRSQILQGKLAPGSAIPSIAALVEEYDTSTTTIRQAINLLRSEGLVFGHQGKGTFVRPARRRMLQLIGDLYSRRATSSPMADVIRSAGAEPHWEHISRVEAATGQIAARLRMAPGHPVMKTDYRFFADDEPIMLSTSFEPLSLTSGTAIEQPEVGIVRGVVARFDSIGRRVDRVEELVSARAPRPHEIQALLIPPGVPIVTIERTYHSGPLMVSTSDIVAPADRYLLKYSAEIP